MLSAEGGSPQWPPSLLRAEQRDDGPPLRLADEKGQAAGEVSERESPLVGLMVGHDPEDRNARPLRAWGRRSKAEGRTQGPCVSQ